MSSRRQRGCGGTVSPARDEIVRQELIALLPRLRRFALVLTKSAADADDLVQATCERAIARVESWVWGTALDRWLFKIAHNLHRNQRRDTVNRERLLQEHAADPDLFAAGPTDAELWTVLQEVRRTVLRLPDEQRAVLILVAVEGLAYRDVAEILGVPIGTVTSRLARARDTMRSAFAVPATTASGLETAP
jgi:RNA polymerase sigma-70 factor (ECF subfamily)